MVNRIILSFVCVFGMSLSVSAKEAQSGSSAAKTLELSITKKGFEPNEFKIKKGTPVVLKVTRTTDRTCAKSIEIPELGVKQDLTELDKTYEVSFIAKSEGKVKFGCSMDQMLKGFFIVE